MTAPTQRREPRLAEGEAKGTRGRPTRHEATRSRIRLADRVEAEGLTICVRHFPAPFGQLVRLGERRHWIAL